MTELPTSYYECPIDGCDFKHHVPPPHIPDDVHDLVDPEAAFMEQVMGIEGALREHFESHSVEDWLRQIMALRAQLGAAANPGEPVTLGCKGCLLGRAQAVAQGVAEAQLPPINRAEFIIAGDSYGRCHINLVDGPIVPGRTASGLIIGNGQIPPINGHGG